MNTIIALSKVLKIFKSIKKKSEYKITTNLINEKEYLEKRAYYDKLVSQILEDIASVPVEHKSVITAEKHELRDYEIVQSLLDPLGMVIKKGDKIYRGVRQESLEYFKTIWETGLLQGLSKNNLIVDTKITNFYTKEFPLILEHKTLNIVNPILFSYKDKKDIAINTAIISKIANLFGITLIDGHSYNSTIHNSEPIFFDIGSFVLKKDFPIDSHKKQIIEGQLFDLLLHNFDNCHLYRNTILTNHFHGCNLSTGLSDSLEYSFIVKKFMQYNKKFNSKIANKLIENIFIHQNILPEEIDVLFKHNFKRTMWQNYSTWTHRDIEKSKIENDRFCKIATIINNFSPNAKTVIDLAGNSGFMSCLLSKTKDFEKIISIDYDESAVVYGQTISKKLNLPVEFGVLNIGNIAKYPLYEYLKSDVVIALAITHHLVLTQNYKLDALFATIKEYVGKHIYIEFCPLGLYFEGGRLPNVPSWYNEKWFEENFIQYFKLLHKEVVATTEVNGKTLNHRVLFVGEVYDIT